MMQEKALTNKKSVSPDAMRYIFLTLVILIQFIVFSFTAPYFLTVSNIINILRQVSEIGIIAIPITLLLISGNMDLSVGSIIGVSAVCAGTFLKMGHSVILSVLIALVIGIGVGLINGLIVAKLKIQAIVVTIGTQVLFRGLCYIITDGRAVSGYPQSFFDIFGADILGIPVSVLCMILFYIIAYLILEKTYLGRYIKATGNNETAARFSGIDTEKVKIMLFCACGVITAIATVFLLTRLSSAEATLGSGYELDIITAALIGGIDINGGKGKLQGTFLGILIIGILRNGLNLMGMSVIYQSIILGVLLLVSVAKLKKKV